MSLNIKKKIFLLDSSIKSNVYPCITSSSKANVAPLFEHSF